MAITKLPVNFKDDVIDTSVSDKRRYNIIDNSDGTKSLEDVTTYEQIGSDFGAEQVNQTNGTVNELIDQANSIESGEKKVKSAEEADKLSTARKINGVEFDGTKDINIDNDFILYNKQTLGFIGNSCIINDERITQDSLADVYFTQDTIEIAEEAVISVETYDGFLGLSSVRTPSGEIKASIKVRVV